MENMNRHRDELFMEWIAAATRGAEGLRESAPSRLKSRIYSAMMEAQAQSGPLLSLTEIKAGGLCVFETLVECSPVSESVKSVNFCHYCHARIMGEKWENAPIYWSHCPYTRFQQRHPKTM